ncbi:tyrosine-type recombinase/integrase [Chromobacterium subtsugae]|uniref:tyrosine-type recombinase/integrase n=1 Tax=Chromobacterium subtsugae TaxID=251747 RepID=UPI0009C06B46|nr:tyrosine-type recombinase/integrase [Chromobacterium subtsugae]
MARKTISGLTLRNNIWHIDKQIKGYGRLRESTGTDDREEAEKFLIHKLDQIRQATIYGVRPKRHWRQAAAKYLLDNQDMPSIGDVAMHLKFLDPYIGDLTLDKIHDGTLEKFKNDRKNGRLKFQNGKGVKNRTINIAIELVIRILNLASKKWRDEFGMTWLETAPSISKLDEKKEKRDPYPMSWEEQRLLMPQLPNHLARMALFKVNTGCREKEVCHLRWEWEIFIPELKTSVFLIPASFGGRTEKSGVKNGTDRLVVLNTVAKGIIDSMRGAHPIYVFPFHENKQPGENDNIERMNGHAWRKARKRAAEEFTKQYWRKANPGFAAIRVHDLKHTFGHRLRVAGVPFEDRQVLLGHQSKSVTTHYSAPEIGHLIAMAERVRETNQRQLVSPTMLRRKTA